MAIPVSAKNVFSWVWFDIYEWQQRQFDGSYTTFQSIARHPCVTIIATDGEYVYLNDEEQPGRPPFRALFGGMVEPGEAPLDAAKRELLEEGGLTSDEWIHYATFPGTSRVIWENSIYIARGCTQVAPPSLDPGEKIILCKYRFEDIVALAHEQNWFRNQEFIVDILRAKALWKLDELKKTILW